MAELRKGFTTGSCAAAAAKAGIYMLLSGSEKKSISITTPGGVTFDAIIDSVVRNRDSISCSVVKDGGDDPDVTTGAHVVATVSLVGKRDHTTFGLLEDVPYVEIDGGEGVGRVTVPGLDQQVGEAAINRVPRQMIQSEVLEVAELFEYNGGIRVVISVPEGREIAQQTFNPRLGIEGGISILGTSGIVEPMSEKALLDTISIEMNQRRLVNGDVLVLSPGNYGQAFMEKAYGYDLDKSVKCSNYIGAAIDMAAKLEFKKVLLAGHIGKLIKLSGGIMNTHSKEADSRMELLCAAALRAGAGRDIATAILECINTEQAVNILKAENVLNDTMNCVMDRAMYYLSKRAGKDMQIECMMYSSEHGMLAKSQGAEEILGEAE